MTQKEIIVALLKDIGDWFPAYSLRGLKTKYGFCGHQADRRARELAEAGLIDHKINEKGHAVYRAKAPVAQESAPTARVTPQDRLFPLPALKPQKFNGYKV